MFIFIGLIIFWISIFSIKLFIENKFQVDEKYSLPITFTLIGIIEFILGILNLLLMGTLLIIALSLIYFIILIKNKNITISKIKEYFNNPTKLIISILFIYITFVSLSMHLTHYDNFSHWGLIIKTMFQYNRLPNFENNYIFFKGYQPGSASFIYYIGTLLGKSEQSMIIGHNYLILSYFTILFNNIKKDKYKNILLLLSFYLFISATSTIGFNDLLVDVLISLQLVSALIIMNNYKDNIKKAFIYTLPIYIYLYLVKNTGLLFDVLLSIYLIYLSFKNNNIKEGIKYSIISFLISIFFLLIWQNHVTLVYGHWALNTKHNLSVQNYYSTFTTSGINHITNFITLYIKHIFSLNITNIYFIIFNILGIIFISLTNKSNKKLLITLDIIYLLYVILLGILYIFSFPWEEAKVFAGYTRYIMTILFVLFGIFINYIITYKNKFNYKTIYLIIISVLLLIPIYREYNCFSTLLGNDHYNNSYVEKFDKIIKYIPKDKDKYYVYVDDSNIDKYFIEHLATYKLLKNNIEVVDNLDNIENNSYIILFNKTNNKDLHRVNKYILEK